MNHLRLILFIPLFLSNLQAQDDSTRAVEWGYLDSLAGVYYFDEIPYSGPVVKQLDIGLMAGEFKDGIKHGLWQTLNQIGDPIMIGHFDNGKKHATKFLFVCPQQDSEFPVVLENYLKKLRVNSFLKFLLSYLRFHLLHLLRFF